MTSSNVSRRTALQTTGAWALVSSVMAAAMRSDSALAQAAAAAPETAENFSADVVKTIAHQLAQKPFSKPRIDLPDPFDKLTYDQYRDIRFRAEQSIWRGEKLDYQLQLFALGYLYDTPVDIWLVEVTQARQL